MIHISQHTYWQDTLSFLVGFLYSISFRAPLISIISFFPSPLLTEILLYLVLLFLKIIILHRRCVLWESAVIYLLHCHSTVFTRITILQLSKCRLPSPTLLTKLEIQNNIKNNTKNIHMDHVYIQDDLYI